MKDEHAKSKLIEKVKRNGDGEEADRYCFVENKEESMKECEHSKANLSSKVKCCILIFK